MEEEEEELKKEDNNSHISTFVNNKINNKAPENEIIVKTIKKKKKEKVKKIKIDSKSISNFKKERVNITQHLYKEFNNVIFKDKLPVNLEIVWSKSLYKTAGRTKLSKKYNKDSKKYIKIAKIELSYKVLDDIDKLRNTLVHEMCHVAVFLIDEIKEKKHGPHFKHWGEIVEGHYSDIEVTTYHSYNINFKYRYQCQECGHIFGRHSNSIDVNKVRCACKGKLKLMEKLKKDGTPYKERTPGKYALYVKENYSKVRKANEGLSQKEIMILLAKEYKKTLLKN